MDPEQHLRETYNRIAVTLSEQSRRLWAASEAITLGYGGISIVSKATGLSRQTIHTGIKELELGTFINDSERVRKKGGGRNRVEEIDECILHDLQLLLKDYFLLAIFPVFVFNFPLFFHQYASQLARLFWQITPKFM